MLAPLASSALQAQNSKENRASELRASYRYLGAGRLDFATLELRRFLREEPPFVEALFLLGIAYHAQGDAERAAEVYQRLATSPDVPEEGRAFALALLGQLRLHSGAYAEAKEAFESADALEEGRALVQYGLGEIAVREGRLDEAVSRFREAASASEEWLLPRVRLAEAYNDLGEHVEAVVVLTESASLGSRDPEFHYQLGRAYIGLLDHLRRGLGSKEQRRLEEFGVPLDVRVLQEAVRHAADRIAQLAPAHSGAHDLIQSLSSS